MAERNPLWREDEAITTWASLALRFRRRWVDRTRADALRRHRAAMTMECTAALCEVLDKYGVTWEVFLRSLPSAHSPYELFAWSRRARRSLGVVETSNLCVCRIRASA